MPTLDRANTNWYRAPGPRAEVEEKEQRSTRRALKQRLVAEATAHGDAHKPELRLFAASLSSSVRSSRIRGMPTCSHCQRNPDQAGGPEDGLQVAGDP